MAPGTSLIQTTHVPSTPVRPAGGHDISPARTFSAVPSGAAFWYVNSSGLAEIAVNGGRADRALGLAVGSEVAIVP